MPPNHPPRTSRNMSSTKPGRKPVTISHDMRLSHGNLVHYSSVTKGYNNTAKNFNCQQTSVPLRQPEHINDPTLVEQAINPGGPPPQLSILTPPIEFQPEADDEWFKPEIVIDWRHNEVKSEEGQEAEEVDLIEETRKLLNSKQRGSRTTQSGHGTTGNRRR